VYGYHPSPIGDVLVGHSGVGVCWVGFVVDGDREAAAGRMTKHWPAAL
jgi:AraC family transcriptional regulator of adaptative response/methylated-DNA-[protein]-cysteine methyltransferase